MQIKFSPVLSSQTLSLSRAGDVLTINGLRYDLSQIGDGDSLPAPNSVICGPITKAGGARSTNATTTAFNVSIYNPSNARITGTASVQASGRWY